VPCDPQFMRDLYTRVVANEIKFPKGHDEAQTFTFYNPDKRGWLTKQVGLPLCAHSRETSHLRGPVFCWLCTFPTLVSSPQRPGLACLSVPFACVGVTVSRVPQ
jgi:hypothetical protein